MSLKDYLAPFSRLREPLNGELRSAEGQKFSVLLRPDNEMVVGPLEYPVGFVRFYNGDVFLGPDAQRAREPIDREYVDAGIQLFRLFDPRVHANALNWELAKPESYDSNRSANEARFTLRYEVSVIGEKLLGMPAVAVRAAVSLYGDAFRTDFYIHELGPEQRQLSLVVWDSSPAIDNSRAEYRFP